MNTANQTDEMERASVGPELQSALRMYRRLYLSYNDLEEAQATIEELLRARIPITRKTAPSPLLMALTTALVVAYARPFVNSRGQSSFAEKSLPGSLLRVLTSKQRGIHDFLIEMRNREVAHSDAEWSEIYLKLHFDGHGAVLRVARSPFLRGELKLIHRIVTKLMEEVDFRCASLRTVLPREVWI